MFIMLIPQVGHSQPALGHSQPDLDIVATLLATHPRPLTFDL